MLTFAGIGKKVTIEELEHILAEVNMHMLPTPERFLQ